MRLIATIDNGNTNASVGVFIDGDLKEVISLSKFQKKYHDKDFQMICSSVGPKERLKDLQNVIFVKDYFKDGCFFSMPVNYSETLGIDRLVVARKIFEESPINTLIIDAGTFITADFVSKDGFLGGYIFPGISTALKSYGLGVELPEYIETSLKPISSLPNNTESAIKDAVTFQVFSTIEALIKKHGPSEVIFTGGCAEILSPHFKNSKVYENLIHESLFELVPD